MKCRATLYVVREEEDTTPIREIPSLVFPAVFPTPNFTGPSGHVTALFGTRDTGAGLQQIYFWAMSQQKGVAQIDISIGENTFVPTRQGRDQLAEITLLNTSSLMVNLKEYVQMILGLGNRDIDECFNEDQSHIDMLWAHGEFSHLEAIAWKMEIIKKDGSQGNIQVVTIKNPGLISDIRIRNMYELADDVSVLAQK